MKLTIRDLFWFVAVLALGLGWWVHAHTPVEIREGQIVLIVQPGDGYRFTRGIAHAVTAEEFSVDTPSSTGLRDGVVLNGNGEFLGVVGGGPNPTLRVERIRISRPNKLSY